MSEERPQGFFRRLGSALAGINEIEYGRTPPTPEPTPVQDPTTSLTLDRLPEDRSADADERTGER